MHNLRDNDSVEEGGGHGGGGELEKEAGFEACEEEGELSIVK